MDKFELDPKALAERTRAGAQATREAYDTRA
jgi:hypothetical protein